MHVLYIHVHVAVNYVMEGVYMYCQCRETARGGDTTKYNIITGINNVHDMD